MKKSAGLYLSAARSLRRARDLAGDALRLCQPRPDPLGAIDGFAQPPLPRRGRPRPEGAPCAVAGAARLAQLRCRSAGDGFGDFDHHRGRPDLPRRQLRRAGGNDKLEHAATLLWDVTTVDPFAPDNCRWCPTRCARWPKLRAARRRSIARLPCWRWPPAPIHARLPAPPKGARWSAAASCGSWWRRCSNASPSAEPLHLQIAKAWAPDNKHAADLIRRALVLLADHELNASTFTVRCAASTGLNLYDAIIAGLVALKGPKHGGAGVLASQLVRTLVDQRRGARHPRARGAGRTFCRLRPRRLQAGDPRAHALLEALARAGAARKFTTEIPERIAEATGEFVNIDYALAVLVHTLRLPPGNELVLFAMARTVGWIAHASEQLRHGGLIRPRARYIGPAPGRGASWLTLRRPRSRCAAATAAEIQTPTRRSGAADHRDHPQCLPILFVMRHSGIVVQR